MPCIHRLGNAKIYVYARGEHPPPHFHLLGTGWEAVIDIKTLTVTRGSAPSTELAEAIQWATDNKQMLQDKWSELNERDDPPSNSPPSNKRNRGR